MRQQLNNPKNSSGKYHSKTTVCQNVGLWVYILCRNRTMFANQNNPTTTTTIQLQKFIVKIVQLGKLKWSVTAFDSPKQLVVRNDNWCWNEAKRQEQKKKRDAEAIEYFFFNYWFISFCTKLNCKNECQSLFNCLVVILQFAYIANNKWEREKESFLHSSQ